MREAAPATKLEMKHAQTGAPEHLRRLERIPKLRAPYMPKGTKPAPRTKT
jgi:hypothetical protein